MLYFIVYPDLCSSSRRWEAPSHMYMRQRVTTRTARCSHGRGQKESSRQLTIYWLGPVLPTPLLLPLQVHCWMEPRPLAPLLLPLQVHCWMEPHPLAPPLLVQLTRPRQTAATALLHRWTPPLHSSCRTSPSCRVQPMRVWVTTYNSPASL